jgi:hypothetical protein
VVMARGCFESGTHSLSSSAWWFPQDVLWARVPPHFHVRSWVPQLI